MIFDVWADLKAPALILNRNNGKRRDSDWRCCCLWVSSEAEVVD